MYYGYCITHISSLHQSTPSLASDGAKLPRIDSVLGRYIPEPVFDHSCLEAWAENTRLLDLEPLADDLRDRVQVGAVAVARDLQLRSLVDHSDSIGQLEVFSLSEQRVALLQPARKREEKYVSMNARASAW